MAEQKDDDYLSPLLPVTFALLSVTFLNHHEYLTETYVIFKRVVTFLFPFLLQLSLHECFYSTKTRSPKIFPEGVDNQGDKNGRKWAET